MVRAMGQPAIRSSSPRPPPICLCELVGPEMGLLDQELLKLAIYVGDRKRIDVDDVDKLVGRSRGGKHLEDF